MSVKIFVEGGGDSKDTLKRCKQGFAEYCKRLAPAGRLPGVIACGGRDEAFDRFKTAVLNRVDDENYVLLVDAEAPVTADTPEKHLQMRDKHWAFPPLAAHKVFLMVQAMEAWFLADREALAAFYGDKFLVKSLPGSPANIEAVLKDDLEPKLKHASRPCVSKGEYHKTRHGFELLAKIAPSKVEVGSWHAKDFNDYLRSL